ncbi:unnamed protein product, partial [Didymodactylos carnosus]
MPPKKKTPNLLQICTKRRFIRGKVEETRGTLKEEKAKEEVDVDVLGVLRGKFEQYKNLLAEYDEIIQQTTNDEDELRDELTESLQIADDLQTALIELEVKIATLSNIGSNEVADSRSVTSNQKSNQRLMPKLPKLEVKKFDGDRIRWQEFWDQFDSSIHSNEFISDVDKFKYLRSYLDGEALRAIDGIPITNAQYAVATEMLRERYVNQQVAIAAHFEKILKLSVVSKKTSDLRLFFDEMEKHIRCLRALGLNEEEFAKTFVPMILMKLPSAIKLELNRKKGDLPWDLQNLRKLLKEEVVARESSNDEGGVEEKKEEKLKNSVSNGKQKQTLKTISTLVTNSKTFMKKCSYCRHHRSLCPKKFGDSLQQKKESESSMKTNINGPEARAQKLAVNATKTGSSAILLVPTQKDTTLEKSGHLVQLRPMLSEFRLSTSKLTLAEPLNTNIENVRLDMLVGSDYYHDIVKEKKIELEKGLFLMDTVFGWILSGRVGEKSQRSGSVIPTLITPANIISSVDAKLENFWKLEAIGVSESGQILDDDVAVKQFNESIEFKDGRYYVSWPWKDKNPDLPQNFKLAHSRLKSLKNRLTQNPELRKKYDEIISKQLNDGVIER